MNLEYLAKGVLTKDGVAYPDSLVGTDSHTTMINGLGVVGWGVGGIEAEAVMLGQPIYMLLPEVVGFKLTGKTAKESPPRTWCSPSPRCCDSTAWSESSSSTTDRVYRRCRFPTGPLLPTWPPSMAPDRLFPSG